MVIVTRLNNDLLIIKNENERKQQARRAIYEIDEMAYELTLLAESWIFERIPQSSTELKRCNDLSGKIFRAIAVRLAIINDNDPDVYPDNFVRAFAEYSQVANRILGSGLGYTPELAEELNSAKERIFKCLNDILMPSE